MTADVIVPYGGCEPYRATALAWVCRHLRSHGWAVSVAVCPSDGWSKGAAVNPVAAESTADVLVIHDADSFVSADGLRRSVDEAAERGWSYPHSRVRRLTPEATTDVYAGAEPDPSRLVRRQAVATPGGGIVCVRRDVWPGMDPRFVGWGGEDQAFGILLAGLVGKLPPRRSETLWHLWHPPAPEAGRGGRESLRLLRRYQIARRSRDRLTELAEEVRCLNVDALSATP